MVYKKIYAYIKWLNYYVERQRRQGGNKNLNLIYDEEKGEFFKPDRI